MDDQKQIPFDFAQGKLSCLAALARQNDKGDRDSSVGRELIRVARSLE